MIVAFHSGGEALYQPDFTVELLRECRRRGIHTTLETCGCVPESDFKASLPYIDYLFVDLKHIDEKEHVRWTGKSNHGILNNARLASSVRAGDKKPLVVRMVVVPGINDGENIAALADFLRSLPHLTLVELLPYHSYGAHKYELLGRSYSFPDLEPPTAADMERCKAVLRARGLSVA